MENVLKTIKNEVIQFNSEIAEKIAHYKKQIEDETDEPCKELLTKMMRCEQMFFIFQIGVINEVKDIVFFRNAVANQQICETELIELINQQVIEYGLEENCYINTCNVLKEKYNTLKKFLIMLEDANLYPEKYNY